MADKRQTHDETPATTNIPTTDTGVNYLRLKGLCVNRIKCDLSHVDIPSALKEPVKNQPEEISGKSDLVVVAKHLCGAGTDLALKSLRDLGDIRCCIMATCCHGVCNWNDYVGREYFVNSLGFGKEEFDLMTRWSAGTVASSSSSSPVSINQESKPTSTYTSQPSESTDTKQLVEEHSYLVDDKQDANNISTIVKELDLQCGVQGLGRACQRLIDYGRCHYMRNILFTPTQNSPKGAGGEQYTVELCHYVDSSVTPQNAVLMASRESNDA
jgi:tRNA:m4X modification enzyme